MDQGKEAVVDLSSANVRLDQSLMLRYESAFAVLVPILDPGQQEECTGNASKDEECNEKVHKLVLVVAKNVIHLDKLSPHRHVFLGTISKLVRNTSNGFASQINRGGMGDLIICAGRCAIYVGATADRSHRIRFWPKPNRLRPATLRSRWTARLADNTLLYSSSTASMLLCVPFWLSKTSVTRRTAFFSRHSHCVRVRSSEPKCAIILRSIAAARGVISATRSAKTDSWRINLL